MEVSLTDPELGHEEEFCKVVAPLTKLFFTNSDGKEEGLFGEEEEEW